MPPAARDYLIVTASYWGFTLVDGALRMVVLLHFFKLGYSPFTLAFLFLLYEFAGIVANLAGGWLAVRFGIPRMLAAGLSARIDKTAWPMPPLFTWLQQQGNVAHAEMHRVFNCGIGMVIVVDVKHAAKAQALLTRAGERVWRIGEVVRRGRGEAQTVVV